MSGEGDKDRDAPEPAAEEPKRGRGSIIEGAIADLVKRGIEAGWERVSRGEGKGTVRSVIGDWKVPKEVASYVGSQLDETKSAILKVAADEIRKFLETSRFADELARLLTTLSFEVKTEVHFVPNPDGKTVRPKVSSKAALRRRKAKTS